MHDEMSKRIDQAVLCLQSGGLVGMPTETVYGLAGDARDPKAVAAIYTLKKRPSFNPLIAHVSSLEMAQLQAEFNSTALKLAEHFWPGPMTLVLPVGVDNTVCELARAGLDTQALRYPDNDVARTLIDRFGNPLTAPSANRSGRVSPTRSEHVREEFGEDLPIILDGGNSVLGLESTVLSVIETEVTMLRPGTLSRDEIEALVGPIKSSLHNDKAPRSPGMLSRHYAPNARLRLNVLSVEAGEAFLGFGHSDMPATLNLSETGDLKEAASNLYAMLRELDETFSEIAVAPIPDKGLGEAINDRLRRACVK